MRILFVTPRFPYPPIKGDTLRAYQQIRALGGSLGHTVSLLSLADAPLTLADRAQVEPLCDTIEVVPLPKWRGMLNMAGGLASTEPLQVHYYHSSRLAQKLHNMERSGGFDAIHVSLIRMLPYVWDMHSTPIVVDLVDSLSLNLEDRRASLRGPKRLAYELEYHRMRAYEKKVVERFPALVVSSPTDRWVLGGRQHINVIPNGVDLDKFTFHQQDGREPQTLVFTGNMGYGPNEEAVLWFISEVWPDLRRSRPHVRFQVVGTNPGDRVKQAAAAAGGIEVLGRVPNVNTYLSKATVAICPMRSGSGIQNKVLEAMAAGAPVLASAIANRGVQGQSGRDLQLANTPSEFVHYTQLLLDDAGLRERLAASGRAFVERNFLWEEHARRLASIYKSVSHRVAA